MALITEFAPLTIAELPSLSHRLKAEGARFVQVLAVRNSFGVDLVYSFMLDGKLLNYRIPKVGAESAVPSITSDFLNAFVFENEAHDLFGVNITDIAIDFAGKFYALQEPTPMMTSEKVKEHMAKGQAVAKKEADARAAAAAKAAEEAKAKAEAEAKAKEEAEGEKPAAEAKDASAGEKPAADAKDATAPEKPAAAVKETLEKVKETAGKVAKATEKKVSAAAKTVAKKAADAKKAVKGKK